MHAGFVMKATRRCNLRCSYCHDWRQGKEFDMSFETVARVTAAILRDPEVDRAQFTWHGGEPTLLPIDFYRRAMLVQSRLKRDGQKIGNALQTNGTLLDHRWCQFLVENRFAVGVSIDGPRSLHDVQRPFISGRGSGERVERGIRLLQDWGIDFGVLMVVDRSTLELGPRALFEFIVALGVPKFGLISANPVNDPTFFERPRALRLAPPEHYTNHTAMTQFLIGLYDVWESHGDTNIQIRELEALRRRIKGEHAGACTLAGACIGKHFLVEANGDFAHCDLFVGDPSYTIGNVYDADFTAIRRSQPLVRLRNNEERSLKAMSSCPYYTTCNGGCPHDRYSSVRYDPKHSADCCGLQDLISALRERILSSAPLGTPV
ncbi:radical SAM protein [Variovorax sp. J22R133]|uniref:radical SAM/SPASM domain-containing protein n=1 Tax=Variovorax brevis TaxID=3053503 RepID=UPI0025771B07|nr:radical SAM protein [Variovorax sp. J22R133]MDM0118031.1 radical SAM protein [Variovorax sp. J22R133]